MRVSEEPSNKRPNPNRPTPSPKKAAVGKICSVCNVQKPIMSSICDEHVLCGACANIPCPSCPKQFFTTSHSSLGALTTCSQCQKQRQCSECIQCHKAMNKKYWCDVCAPKHNELLTHHPKLVVKSSGLLCSKHKQPAKEFCLNCNNFVCAEFLTKLHHDHKTFSLEDYVDQQKKNLFHETFKKEHKNLDDLDHEIETKKRELAEKEFEKLIKKKELDAREQFLQASPEFTSLTASQLGNKKKFSLSAALKTQMKFILVVPFRFMDSGHCVILTFNSKEDPSNTISFLKNEVKKQANVSIPIAADWEADWWVDYAKLKQQVKKNKYLHFSKTGELSTCTFENSEWQNKPFVPSKSFKFMFQTKLLGESV